MIMINTHQAKSKLSELLAAIESKHETVIICRNGKPVAEMIPWEKTHKNPLAQDPLLKKIVIKEDPSLPPEETDWPEEAR
jgi:prevent-host-death family protein